MNYKELKEHYSNIFKQLLTEVYTSAELTFEIKSFTQSNFRLSKILKNKLSFNVITDENKNNNNENILIKVSEDVNTDIKSVSLTTPFLDYKTFIDLLTNINLWISENGSTKSTDYINLRIKLKDTIKNHGTNLKLYNINKIKFCLNIDEDYIFEKFPKSSQNKTLTIKQFKPINPYISDVNGVNMYNYIMPYLSTDNNITSLINFNDDFISFNYIKGKKYENKTQDIIDILTYFIIYTYHILKFNEFDVFDQIKINKYIEPLKLKVSSFINLETFQTKYPNIKLSVDLTQDLNVIHAYWNIISDVLFYLICYGNFKEGWLNYDSDLSKFQILNGYLKNAAFIENVEFLRCKIKGGSLKQCIFSDCEMTAVNLIQCEIKGLSKLSECYLNETFTSQNCNLEKCTIDNSNVIYSGNFNKCKFLNKLPSEKLSNIN